MRVRLTFIRSLKTKGPALDARPHLVKRGVEPTSYCPHSSNYNALIGRHCIDLLILSISCLSKNSEVVTFSFLDDKIRRT
jgi:hypothetical protein